MDEARDVGAVADEEIDVQSAVAGEDLARLHVAQAGRRRRPDDPGQAGVAGDQGGERALESAALLEARAGLLRDGLLVEVEQGGRRLAVPELEGLEVAAVAPVAGGVRRLDDLDGVVLQRRGRPGPAPRAGRARG